MKINSMMNHLNCKIVKCQLRGLNPRPFGMAPKATALDHSAKLTIHSFKKNGI